MKRAFLMFLFVLSSCLGSGTPDAGRKVGSFTATQSVFITLEAFGAKGDGVTNDSAAMTAALSAAAGGSLQLACNKTYLIGASSPYSVPAKTTIIGCGDGSVFKTLTDGPLLVPSGEETSFLSFKILGSGTGTTTNQIGIANQPIGSPGLSGFHRIRIDKVSFSGLFAAVLEYQGNIPFPYYNAQISNVRIDNVGSYGLWLLDEYVAVTNAQIDCGGAVGSNIGIEAQSAGNQTYVGGTITGCAIGFDLVGGGNDSHGTVAGFLINHNTTNLHVWNNMTQGEEFVGDHFYSGDIILTSTHAVVLRSCHIDVGNIYLDGSIGTVLSGDTWPNGCCTNTIHNSYNSHASTTFADGWNIDLNGNASSVVAAAGWGWSPKQGLSSVVFASDANRTASAADYSNDYLAVTSGVSLTATRQLILPISAGAVFDVFNNTTGAQSITVIGASGTGVTLANGKRQRIRNDGTNYVAVTAAN